MATRSRIGIELPGGSIVSVYHHWDGYPSWLGKILVEHYNNRQLATDLVDGGDMSNAYTNHRFDSECLFQTTYDSEGRATRKVLEDADGDTIYTNIKEVPGPQYYSERGEDTPPALHNSLDEFFAVGEEYAYVFTLNNEWVAYDLHQFEDDKQPEMVAIPREVPTLV